MKFGDIITQEQAGLPLQLQPELILPEKR